MVLVHVLATLLGSFAATAGTLLAGHGLLAALGAYVLGGVAGLLGSAGLVLVLRALPPLARPPTKDIPAEVPVRAHPDA